MTTISTIEYALMAGGAYISNRSPINQFPVPNGWTETKHVTSPTGGSGFEAVTFINGPDIASSTNIVISFAGTDGNGGSLLTNADKQADLALGLGLWSAQLGEAADYYLQIKALNPNATITLTGHSLGGGLAALIGIFFGVSATTFDQAPFASAAKSDATALMNYLTGEVDSQGNRLYSNAQLSGLANYIQQQQADPSTIPNAGLVTDVSVAGQLLSGLPYSLANIIGAEKTSSPISNNQGVSGDDLHSQALLTAFLQSQQSATTGQALNDVTFKLTDLLKMIFDDHLFAHRTDPRSTAANFLELIVDHQAGFNPVTQAAITSGTNTPGDGMVSRFNTDLWQIAQPGGLTMIDKNLTDALIAFGMQKYYYESMQGVDAGQTLFNAVSGGIEFNMNNVASSLEQAKGFGKYFVYYLLPANAGTTQQTNDHLSYLTSGERSQILKMLFGLTDWYIQAGSGGMTVTETAGLNAFMLGGSTANDLTGGTGNDLLVAGASGADTLDGGAGNDVLMAGSGDDVLITGQGNDTVYGGSGADTFNFVSSGSGSATETIKYDNGKGSVEVNGTQLSDVTTLLASGSTGSTWQDSNGDQYQFVASTDFINGLSNDPSDITGTLTISQGLLGSGNQIVIDDFDLNAAQSSAGYLGMKFREQLALQANASATSPFVSGIPSDQTAAVGHGNTQTFTVYASSVSDTDQTIQLASSGAGSYAISTGAALIPLSGTVSLLLSAGQSQATFTLIDLSNTSSPDTAQLTASLTDANGNVISSNNLTIAFNAPSAGTPTPSAGTADRTIIGDLQPVNFGTSSSPQYHYDDLNNIVVNGTASPGRDDTLYGSMGNDLINTGDGNNYVGAAQGGNDTINGGSGNDFLLAGDGSNTINSGDGNDTVQAGNGDNTITGGAGSDNVTAGNGNNVIFGNDGPDVLIAGSGNNQIYANQQTDVATALAQAKSASPSGSKGTLLAVGDGNNTIVGGTGNDAIFTGTGNNTIVCGPGSVSLMGGVETASAITDWYVTLTNTNTFFNGVDSASAPFNAPSNYNGSTFNGVPVGLGNDTIFGGKGDSSYWLSNGNNWLDAGGGNDIIQAGIGNNTIFGGAGSDSIWGGGGNNFINLESGNDYVIAQGGNNTIIGGTGNDTVASGDTGANWATSETSANNYIYGGAGNSVIFGSGGNDTLIGGTGNASIYGGDGNEYIVGGYGNVSINGGNGNDTIYAGGNGNDTIFAGDGNTTIYGGGGSDTIVGGAGTDIITAGDGGTAAAPTMLYAGSGTSTLYGGAGTDQLFGGTGSDTLVAGTGNSTLQGGSGTEVIYASIGTATLIAGSGSDTLYGGEGNATLQGGSGTTLMVAGGGANTFIGGSGQNTYEVDPGSGNITIQPGSPGDILLFGSGIALADISVTANVTEAGQSVLVIDVATGGSISIVGGLTDSLDQFNVGGAPYTLQQLLQAASTNPSDSAGATGDLIFSAYAGDTLAGTGGNDTIAAYGANATLAGGGGDTTFIVTDASQVVSETNSNINDTIQSSVSYVLPANVQNLALFGQADLVATGNDLANVLTANNGNDTLIAGAGVATMIGGTGFGTFVVNNAADVVQAQANAANNTVQSSVSYVVPENVQTLILTGNGDLTGTGNDQANTIQANNGNDTLIAGAGVVTLKGGTGNDTFVINNAADVVQAQAGGTNAVQTSVSYMAPDNVQNLVGTGTSDLALTGNSQTNTVVTANAGNDTLRGGSGSGTLVGGSGQDTFVFGTAGNYTAEKAASTNATVQLDPGLDFTEVSAVQLGNDLLLQVGGTASSLRLQNYFLDPQAWSIEDALGNTTTAQALLDATTLESANKLSQLEHQFLTQVKAGYIQNLINQGYSQQADGSWSIAPSMSGSISAQYVIDDGYVATQKWDLTTGILSYSTPTPQQSTSWSSSYPSYSEQTATIQQTTTNATDQVINANAGGTSWTPNAVWFKVNWNYSLGLPTGTYAYGNTPVATNGPIGGISLPYGAFSYEYDGAIYWQVQWGTNNSYSVSGTLDGGIPGAMLSSPGYLTTHGPFPQAIAGDFYQLQTRDVIQQINVGAGDHTVYGAFSNYVGPYGSYVTLVNSGSGNNTIYDAGFVDAGTGNDSIYNAGIVYSESGNDYINHASTVYGGSGNDTIIGATTVVTGIGNDTIFESGPGTITINPGINGMDLIGNSGGADLDAEFLDAYYQVQGVNDGAERYRYAGLYDVLIPEGSGTDGVWGNFGHSDAQNAMQLFSMYGGLAAPTTLQQAIDQGWLTYINPLPYLVDLRDRGDFGAGGIWPSSYYETSGTPVTASIGANDFAALAPVFDSGALPTETINFGPSISLADLQFSWGIVTTDEGGNVPLGTYATLSMTWGQNQGIEVIIPHQDQPIGSGVQEFIFADSGAKMSMADMIALAPPAPTLDPEIFTFKQGIGQQVLPSYAQQVVFAAGINISNLSLSLNGTDLVFSAQGGADSLIIPNGAADIRVIENLAFTLADGSTLSYYYNHWSYTFSRGDSQGNYLGSLWCGVDGSSGWDTHNPVTNAASGYTLNADGSTSTFTDDGQGNYSKDDYDPHGNKTGDNWTKSDGSSGSDSFNPLTGTSSGVTNYADGSSTSYTNDGQGDVTTLQYDTQGNYTGDQWVRANGSQGSDSYDVLTGQASGISTLASGSAIVWNTTPPGGGNLLITTSPGDTLTGGTGTDSLFGFANNDTLTAGSGGNYLYGSGNGDVLVSGAGNDLLVGTGNNDTFVINPGSGVDTIIAAGTNDTLVFGPGITSSMLTLGLGSLLIRDGIAGDAIHIEGFDSTNALNTGSIQTFQFSDPTVLTYAQLLARGFDIYGTTGDETLTGTNLDNRIYAGSGNDILIGSCANDTLIAGSGIDTLIGGLGNETFVVNNTADIVTAQANAASNTVLTSVSYVAPANVQTLTGTGTGDITLTGNSLNDVITANSGNDILIAGSGNDTLISGTGIDTLVGGTGNDTFVVNNANDVIQVAGSGNSITLTGSGGTLNSGTAAETVYATGGSETITVGDGSTVTLSGTNSDATVGSNSTVTVNGTDNSVTAGNGSTITLNANTHTGLSLNHGTVDYNGSNLWCTMAGSNDILNLASGATGDMALLFGNNNTINVASAGNSFTLLGTGDTLNSGTAAETVWDYANSTHVTVGDGSTVTLYASNSTTTVGSNSSVSLGGTNNSVTAGSGSTITVNAGTGNGLTLTDGIVNVTGSNTSYAIYGSGNTVNTASGATGNLALVMGDGNTLDAASAGNTFNLVGANEVLDSGTAAETVNATGDAETITVGSASTVTLSGTNSHATVGSGSSVSMSGVDNSVDIGIGSTITLNTGAHAGLTINHGTINYAGSNIWSTTLGANNTYNLASGVTGDFALVFGNNNTFNVASAGNSFTLLGSGDVLNSGTAAETVWDYANNTSVTVGDGSAVTLYASNSTTTVGDGSTVSVGGSNNSVTAGNGSTIGLNSGTNNGLTLTDGIVNVTGSNTSYAIYGSGNTVNTASGATGNLALVMGDGNTLDAASAGNTFNLVGANEVLDSGTAAEMVYSIGGSEAITVGAGSTVTLNDYNDSVTVGNNSTVVLDDFNDSVTIGSNSTVTVDGDIDSVTVGSSSIITLVSGLGNVLTLTDDTLNVTGSDVWSTIIGSNTTINLATDVTGNLMEVFGNNNTINVASAGNSFTLRGSGHVLNSGLATEAVWEYANNTCVTVGDGSSVTIAASNSTTTVGDGSTVTVSGGNDTVIAGSGSTVTNADASDVILFQAGGFQAGGVNTLQTSVSYVTPSNVQNLLGTGSGNLVLQGNSLDDFILGNAGNDTLVGGSGTDVLQAGTGNTTMTDSNGSAALIGMGGNDALIGGSMKDFLAGGAGNDTYTTGASSNVISFNKGDGADLINATAGATNTLSVGGGINYTDLSLSKNGNNLILTEGTDTLTFSNWYASSANQNFVNLQVIEQASSTYSATSTSPLYNQKVVDLSFSSLVSQFNTALAATPTLTQWSVTNGLLNAYLSGSNTAAMGGDLAYYDGMNGSLSGMNVAAAQTALQNASFGTSAQSISVWSSVSQAAVAIH